MPSGHRLDYLFVMGGLESNPFAALTLIVAPAVLTNASSVLVLSTSNRFARAVDRARTVAAELEKLAVHRDEPLITLRMAQLGRLERRSLMLLMAMRLFYLALGCFASATLVSVIGAIAVTSGITLLVKILEGAAALVGVIGVGGLVVGSAYLVSDTRLAVFNVSDEAAHLRERLRSSLANP